MSFEIIGESAKLVDLARLLQNFLINFGEVAEWLKAHAWKACGYRKVAQEFESLPLRNFYCQHKSFNRKGQRFAVYIEKIRMLIRLCLNKCYC